jgi:uncharacterized protein (TIGR03437 family)
MAAADLLGAVPPGTALTVQVSTEIAPAWGWVQVKLSLAAPALVGSGRIVMDFDPTVFGPIGTVAVFSAAGDALGFATVQGQHLAASFASPSGGIGQLRNLPVLVATIPVLQNAKPGTVVSIAADASQSTWQDPKGNTYSVVVTPGSVTVAGSLSIQSVTPGGGNVPAGGTVEIKGGGFTPQTTVTIDGVGTASTSFVGPQEIDVTLAGPTEMTGKRVVLQNPDASSVAYFASLGGLAPSTWLVPGPAYSLFPNAQPTFPLEAQLTGIVNAPGDSPGSAMGLQNPTSTPIAVTLSQFALSSLDSTSTVTIPPYGAALYSLPGVDSVVVSAKNPLRMMQIVSVKPYFPSETNPAPWLSPVGPAPIQRIGIGGPGPSFTWQIGTAPPPPQTISADPGQPGIPLDYAVSASTSSGGAWLSVTPGKANTSQFANFTVSVNPAGLAPGAYNGTITATPLEAIGQAVVAPVTLTVLPANYVTISPSYSELTFVVYPGVPLPSPATISMVSGTPVAVSVTSSIQSGGNWFSVSVSSTSTPATLTVTPDTSHLGLGTYNGTIVITGPHNSISLPVALYISGPPQLQLRPSSLIFSGPAGGPAPNPQFVELSPVVKIASSVTTASTPPIVTSTPASLTFAVPSGSNSVQTINVQSSQPPVTWVAYSTVAYMSKYSSEISVDCRPPTCSVTASPALPGMYYGTIQFVRPDGGMEGSVPVTVLAGVTAAQPPVISSVVNAATQIAGAFSPGEIVSVHGIGVGPAAIDGFTLDASGKVGSTLDSVDIRFDGKPAPLLYASPTQVNVIVPYEVAGKPVTTIQVINQGIQSAAWGVPVAPATPGIFTLDATGQGPAAVLNQDSSVNSPANPALRGSTIQIFATGGGQTSPPSATGTITQSATEMLALPVAVSIGGVDAQAVYAGAAPQEVAGLVQVNAVVPQGVVPGPATPLSIRIGGAESTGGVTVAVQ